MGRFDLDGMIRRLGGASTPDPRQVQAMIAARRRMVDQPWAIEEFNGAGVRHPQVLRYRGGRDGVPVDLQDDVLERAIEGWANVAEGRSLGTFASMPDTDILGVVTYPKMNKNNRRHEVMHAYNEAAMRGVEGMPFSSRAIAAIGGGHEASTLRGGVARALDELVAQKVGGATYVPWDRYASVYTDAGQPWAARTARVLSAAQEAQKHPELVGLGLGAAATLGAATAAAQHGGE